MRPVLGLIVDVRQREEEIVRLVRAALRGGIDWIQLRNKAAPAVEMYRAARAVRDTVRELGGRLFINDRLDVALLVQADGVHLAGQSLPTGAVKAAYPFLRVGRSVHSLAEAEEAAREGADYVVFGTVYPSPSKPGGVAQGLGALREVAERVPCPVLAIGGITPERVGDVLRAGAQGALVISTVGGSPDPEEAARRLREAADAVGEGRS